MIYRRDHSIEVALGAYVRTFGSQSAARERCFNIGAGTWKHEAWTNIDLPPQSKEFADIQAPCIYHDLVECEELPIEENSAQLLYTSHVIEHLPDIHVRKLFRSAFKSLRDGGILRVVTGPDADTDYAALMRMDDNWWYFYSDSDFAAGVRECGPLTLSDKWLLHLATPRSAYSQTPCSQKYLGHEVADLIDAHRGNPEYVRNVLTDGLRFNHSYPGDHLSWWNADKLIRTMKEAGFKTIEKSAYGQSRCHFMRDLSIFDTTYPQISLYVEAVK